MRMGTIAELDAAQLHHFVVSLSQARWSISTGADRNALQELYGSVQPGIYEHWKSDSKCQKMYLVQGVTTNPDTFEAAVSYRSLYAPHQGDFISRELLHPERGFLTPINRDGFMGQRFMLIKSLDLAQLTKVLSNISVLSHISDREQFFQRLCSLVKA